MSRLTNHHRVLEREAAKPHIFLCLSETGALQKSEVSSPGSTALLSVCFHPATATSCVCYWRRGGWGGVQGFTNPLSSQHPHSPAAGQGTTQSVSHTAPLPELGRSGGWERERDDELGKRNNEKNNSQTTDNLGVKWENKVYWVIKNWNIFMKLCLYSPVGHVCSLTLETTQVPPGWIYLLKTREIEHISSPRAADGN